MELIVAGTSPAMKEVTIFLQAKYGKNKDARKILVKVEIIYRIGNLWEMYGYAGCE